MPVEHLHENKATSASDFARQHYAFFHMKEHNLYFELYPLSGEEFCSIRQYSVPVNYDHASMMIYLSAKYKTMLPEWYIGLSEFGLQSERYDEYKGAFAFCFKVIIENTETKISCEYLCNMMNYRSYVEFNMYKILSLQEVENIDLQVYQSIYPEFSQKIFDFFYLRLYAHCKRVCAKKLKNFEVNNFLMKVQSNHILFGCYDNELFEETINDSDEFVKQFEQYSQKMIISSAKQDKNHKFGIKKSDKEAAEEEGKMEEKITIAKRLKASGFGVAEIANITELSYTEIEQL